MAATVEIAWPGGTTARYDGKSWTSDSAIAGVETLNLLTEDFAITIPRSQPNFVYARAARIAEMLGARVLTPAPPEEEEPGDLLDADGNVEPFI